MKIWQNCLDFHQISKIVCPLFCDLQCINDHPKNQTKYNQKCCKNVKKLTNFTKCSKLHVSIFGIYNVSTIMINHHTKIGKIHKMSKIVCQHFCDLQCVKKSSKKFCKNLKIWQKKKKISLIYTKRPKFKKFFPKLNFFFFVV